MERLQAEVAAVGFTLIGANDGVPVCEETLSKAEEDLIAAIIEEHIWNPHEYLNVDLNKVAPKTKALATTGQFDAYKAVQTAVIAEQKRAELSSTSGLYLDWQKDKENLEPTADAKRTTWLTAVSGIQTLQSIVEEK